jgi:hypothetical protein
VDKRSAGIGAMKKALKSFSILGFIAFAILIALGLMHKSENQTPSSSSDTSLRTEEKVVSTSASPQSPTQTAHQNSSEDFKRLSAQVLKDLPTNSDLRKLSAAEVHHTPAIILQASSRLADVAEVLDTRLKQSEKNSAERAKVIQDGLVFYKECLDGEERPDSIRALCYSHYRELRKLSGKPETQAEARNVPERVRSLVDLLKS